MEQKLVVHEQHFQDNVHMLHGDFFSYNLKEGDNIDAHVLNVENMTHRLSDLG